MPTPAECLEVPLLKAIAEAEVLIREAAAIALNLITVAAAQDEMENQNELNLAQMRLYDILMLEAECLMPPAGVMPAGGGMPTPPTMAGTMARVVGIELDRHDCQREIAACKSELDRLKRKKDKLTFDKAEADAKVKVKQAEVEALKAKAKK